LLLTHAGGNPLYAEQYARMLSEHGDAAGLPLPETVQGIIAARLDALPFEEKALLQDAAVVGKVFWTGAFPGDSKVLRAGLHALERKEFIRREGHSAVKGQEQYAFRHVLLRDVAHGQIPRAERADKHLRAAEWLEALDRRDDHAEAIAHHYLSALEYLRALGKDWSRFAAPAGRALVAAGERASALNAFAVAAGYYEQALALGPHDDAKRPLISFALAEALHRCGAGEQRQRLQQARQELLAAGEYERAAEAEAMLAELAWFEGHDEQALAQLERALRLVHDRPGSPARARVLANVADVRLGSAQYEAAIEVATEARELAEKLDLPDIHADALITLGAARVWLADARGVQDVERGLALALASNALIVAERGYTQLWNALALESPTELERLGRLQEESTRLAERLGNVHLLRFARMSMIGIQRFVGEWDNALQAADDFIAESERGSAKTGEFQVRLQRAYIRQARDDCTGAQDDIEKALALADERRLRFRTPFAVFLLFELGRVEQAKALAAQIVHAYPWLTMSEFAVVAAEVGSLSKLRRALDTLPRQRPPDIAARAIIDGRLVEAADLLTEMGRFVPAARVRLRAAETLLAGGRPVEARVQLEKALAFYKSVGATRYIHQAETLVASNKLGAAFSGS
jgi:hypothetical protein